MVDEKMPRHAVVETGRRPKLTQDDEALTLAIGIFRAVLILLLLAASWPEAL
jgi:hypothetical protein